MRCVFLLSVDGGVPLPEVCYCLELLLGSQRPVEGLVEPSASHYMHEPSPLRWRHAERKEADARDEV
ncbi:hypothetical protein EYF80_024288 [Liparis tanakae]|uniref:Uncharacterized protein n=1 Tax=Liparis tanakae TaxID=230148 RepID=A0A4Z2HHT4_9TELE|nr:hypothetical protein EYF80_024288 [Liparis tanakae]